MRSSDEKIAAYRRYLEQCDPILRPTLEDLIKREETKQELAR